MARSKNARAEATHSGRLGANFQSPIADCPLDAACAANNNDMEQKPTTLAEMGCRLWKLPAVSEVIS